MAEAINEPVFESGFRFRVRTATANVKAWALRSARRARNWFQRSWTWIKQSSTSLLKWTGTKASQFGSWTGARFRAAGRVLKSGAARVGQLALSGLTKAGALVLFTARKTAFFFLRSAGWVLRIASWLFQTVFGFTLIALMAVVLVLGFVGYGGMRAEEAYDDVVHSRIVKMSKGFKKTPVAESVVAGEVIPEVVPQEVAVQTLKEQNDEAILADLALEEQAQAERLQFLKDIPPFTDEEVTRLLSIENITEEELIKGETEVLFAIYNNAFNRYLPTREGRPMSYWSGRLAILRAYEAQPWEIAGQPKQRIVSREMNKAYIMYEMDHEDNAFQVYQQGMEAEIDRIHKKHAAEKPPAAKKAPAKKAAGR